jgi:6-phosphogluconolactonase (cycloisomerase 2 family)
MKKKHQYTGTLRFVFTLLFISFSALHAAKPLFSIIPLEGSITALLLPNNFSETVQYHITNQTNFTRTLKMEAIPGVAQTGLPSQYCASPFTLAPQQSCILNLIVNGSQVPASGINRGPVVCKANGFSNPNLCSQPSLANTLAVSSTTAGQYAYVANQLGNSVSVCQVNPATGLLSRCSIAVTGLGNPEGIGFNPAGTFLYISNPNGSYITVCKVNKTNGSLSDCQNAGGSEFDLPNAFGFSQDGTILYTSNLGGLGSVTACLIDATTGELSSCIKNLNVTFGDSAGMILNSSGTKAYVANRSKNTISVCHVSGQIVGPCDAQLKNEFDEPEGVVLSPLGLHAYITNAGSKSITVCDIREDGTDLLEHCAVTEGMFAGTGNIAFNSQGTVAYVPNEILHQLFVCNVALPTGQLSRCIPSRGTGFIGPAGVELLG